jgi:hypothetical protein
VLIYIGVAIATARLRAPQFAQDVPPARFRAPAPRVVLLLSVLGSLSILTVMTFSQLVTIATGLLAGLPLYLACGPDSGLRRGAWQRTNSPDATHQ